MLVPVQSLFEAHLYVSNLPRSLAFYSELLGLPLAAKFPDRRVAFVWAGPPGQAMLGLWDVGPAPQRLELHLAFRVDLDDLLNAPQALKKCRHSAPQFQRRAHGGSRCARMDAGGVHLLSRS